MHPPKDPLSRRKSGPKRSIPNSSGETSTQAYPTFTMDSKPTDAEQVPTRRKMKNPFKIHKDDDYMCNILGWKPHWLQICNNMKVFMFCYVCVGIFRGMYHSYFSSMLPSIEKRFGFTSTSVGTIKSMSDVSHLIAALFVGHYGGVGHRPRWMAVGSLLVGLGLLLMASPELFFPAEGSASMTAMMYASADSNENLCNAKRNTTSANTDADSENCAKTNNDHINPMIVLGAAEFIIGLGSTASMILGLPFVDDNVKTKNSPLYFAMSFSGFIFGPLIGISVAAYFNTVYFNFSKPDFRPTDPRWISAWYMGFIISGLGVCFFSFTLSCFPARMKMRSKKDKVMTVESVSKPVEDDTAVSKEEEASRAFPPPPMVRSNSVKPVPKRVELKDLPKNIKRLLRNRAYLIKLCAQLLGSFVLAGYMSFAQKFLKEQYQLPQSVTNTAGGIPPIFLGFLGILLGSFLIRRFKFSPKQVCYMMAASSLIGSICYFSVIGMGCEKEDVLGIDDVANPYNTTGDQTCHVQRDCNCVDFSFAPICNTVTKKSYLSACYAGCKTARRNPHAREKEYMGCSCAWNGFSRNSSHFMANHTNLAHSHLNDTRPPRVVSGLCKKDCLGSFIKYVVAISIAKFCMGFPLSGILMLQFRIVDVDLKSLANAVTTVVTSTLGLLPAPILVGKLIDSTCRLWAQNPCGTQGACWLYNADNFRWKLHASVGVVRIVTMILELLLAYQVRNITFDREGDAKRAAGGPPQSESSASVSVATSSISLTMADNSSDSGISDEQEQDQEQDPATAIHDAHQKSMLVSPSGEMPT
ncbi:hypothetical protein RvY_15583 [Ramazzottius varieornatus]|uniref:Solute carrier organic anion transporter family member n=1 Tax=Ramazzottius varieornatus TaxID=947166 RepID=A0A1D1VVF2_RAMVA|nr:hypothetical protein RvY_15583 [Ramazzottius varieornatus]